MQEKPWTQIYICSKQNHLLYSYILQTQNLLDVDESMRGELSSQEDGSYATAYRWEDLDEEGTSPLFPSYSINKPDLFSGVMSNAVLDAFRRIFKD